MRPVDQYAKARVPRADVGQRQANSQVCAPLNLFAACESGFMREQPELATNYSGLPRPSGYKPYTKELE